MVLLSWLQVQQRNNLGTFAADSFIPALGPSDMMSVSCVDLSHSITYVIDKGMLLTFNHSLTSFSSFLRYFSCSAPISV